METPHERPQNIFFQFVAKIVPNSAPREYMKNSVGVGRVQPRIVGPLLSRDAALGRGPEQGPTIKL